MKTTRNISLLLALAGQAALAVAQSANQPDKELAPIVVSASRSSTRAQDMPLSTTVVDRENLDIAPGQTLDQILKNVPGINLTDIPSFAQHPTGQGISMRGLGNARTLVLLDGIPLNDPFYGTVQWSKVPLSSIKRVEVVRGAASSLWGNLAMGGVINIITKLPTRDQTQVTASYGSFNTSTLAIARDVVASDTLQFRLSADNFLTSGYRTMPASQVLGAPNSAYARSVAGGTYARNSNAQLAAYFQPSATLSGYLRAGFHELHELSGGQNIAPNHRQNADLALGLTQELGRSSRIEGKFWHQETNFDSISGRYTPNTYVSASYDNPYRDSGASAVWSRAFRGALSQLQVGADVRRISGSDLATNFSGAGNTISATEYGSGTHAFYGIFSQAKLVSPSKRLDATLSARYDYWRNDGELTNTPYSGNKPAASGASVSNFGSGKGSFNPSLALRWQASHAVTLRAVTYRAFHAPGLNNMYRSYGSGASASIANPDLVPETLTGYEFGIDYQAQRASGKLTVFSNDVKNLVTTYTLSDGTGGTTDEIALYCPGICSTGARRYINAGRAQMQGLESELKYALSPAVVLNANYVYTAAVLKESDTTDPTGRQIAGIPRQTMFVGASWHIVPRWRVHGEVRVVSETWNETAHVNRIPGYASVNLSSNYQLTKSIGLFGSIVNLFDREYLVTGSPRSPQTLGMPFAAFFGIRMTL